MQQDYKPSAGEHPITPPPELVEQWIDSNIEEHTERVLIHGVANLAAQWGADQELKACCVLMDEWGLDGEDLVGCRRPKPLSLKEQALDQLRRVNAVLQFQTDGSETSVIRRALEALDD